MAIIIRIPTPLRTITGGQATLETAGSNVKEALAKASETYPELGARLYDEKGKLRRFINFFVNGEDIRHGDGDRTALKDGDEIAIVPAIAGGAS